VSSVTRLRQLLTAFADRDQVRTAASFVAYLVRRANDDDCLRSAAALTYMSLFALVPLITVVYAMFAAVPAFAAAGEAVQSFIFIHFVPSTGAEIEAYLSRFSEQARNLTGIGVLFLMGTALTMLMNIEASFNRIWGVNRNRSWLSSFLLYWAVLTFGPLLIGLAFAISTYVASLRYLFDQAYFFGLQRVLFSIGPWILTSCAFTLLFVAVPNCRVPARHALIGGLLAGLAFEIAKFLFGRFIANASYQVVYGAFAAIPVFLLWVYFSWIIVLVGAELVQALSSFGGRQIRHIPEVVLALAVLRHLWCRHQTGDVVNERELLRGNWLLGRYNLSRDRWVRLRERLLAGNLIRMSDNGDYLLARDLHHYTLWNLVEHMDLLPKALAKLVHYPDHWLQHSRTLLEDLRDDSRERLEIPLATLFEQQESAPAATGRAPARRPRLLN
jgi:membrane protein